MIVRLSFQTGPLAGRRIEVSTDATIGRADDNAIVLADPSVSAHHGRIYFRDGTPWIEDFGSTNGIAVNGITVREAELRAGDRGAFGDVQFIVESVDAACGVSPARPASWWQRHKQTVRPLLVAAAILMVVLLTAVFDRVTGPKWNRRPGLVRPATLNETAKEFKLEGVALTIRETAGLDRKSEPVTSGLPLPEGLVKETAALTLLDAAKKPVPCQFIPQCRWPDGSLKWVLLDFQADLAASNTATYTLIRGEVSAPLAHPVMTVESSTGIVVDNGSLRLEIHKDKPGLIHRICLDGAELVSPAAPVGTVLMNDSNRVYRASTPKKVIVETRGPMRTVILVQGEYVADRGERIFGGKIGYDLRVTVYAGQPNVKLDFTFKNDGWYGYHNEGNNHPRQWFFLKSLRLDVPLQSRGGDEPRPEFAGRVIPLTGTNEVALTQWYKYPYKDERMFLDIYYTNLVHEVAGQMRTKKRGYYHVWTDNGVMSGREGATEGRATIGANGVVRAALEVRRFKENFPAGFSAARMASGSATRLSFNMFPEGGCWPRTWPAFNACTYQFEGGRRKTATLILKLGDAARDATTAALQSPLYARAPTAWYRGTGAVLPLADGNLGDGKDPELREAMARYDQQQIAKVRAEAGDTAGPVPPFNDDVWGRVSIPGLWERCPGIFAGWMNFGDLV